MRADLSVQLIERQMARLLTENPSHPLPVELLKLLIDYDEDTGLLYWRKRPEGLFIRPSRTAAWNTKYAGKEALRFVDDGYKRGAILGRPYSAHRVAWAIATGRWPDTEIDHINGVRHDNRLVNLREASRLEQNRNTSIRSDNTSGIVGVSWRQREQKWRVQIQGRHLGSYANLEDARAARKLAEKLLGYHENHGRAA